MAIIDVENIQNSSSAMSNLEKRLSSGNGSDSMESNIVINDEINLVKHQVNHNNPKTIRNLDS